MNCRHRGKAPAPNSSKEKDPKGKNANGVKSYADKHGMERRQRQPDPDWEGSGKAVKWS